MGFSISSDKALDFIDEQDGLVWMLEQARLESAFIAQQKREVAKARRQERNRLQKLQAAGQALGLEAWGTLDAEGQTAEQCLGFERLVKQTRWFGGVVNPTLDSTTTGWRVRCAESDASVVVTRGEAMPLLKLCLDNPKKLDYLLELRLRFGWLPRRLSGLQGMSVPGMAALVAALDWLKPRRRSLMTSMVPKALRALGRTSEASRWPLIRHLADTRPAYDVTGRPDKAVLLEHLDWAFARQARKSPALRLLALPAAEQWMHLFGFAAPEDLMLTDLTGFKVKVFRALCPVMGLTLSQKGLSQVGNAQPLFNLVRLFGDEQAIRRFVKNSGNAWSKKGLHDAGQFTLPKRRGWTPAKWAPLCLKAPAAVGYAQEFSNLEKVGRFPESLAKLRREVILLGYPEMQPGDEKLAEVCLNAKLTGEDFKAYKAFWQKVEHKPAEFLPHVEVLGEDLGLPPGWRFTKLQASDYHGPMLGQLTGCCQHLRGAGSESAKHGVVSPFSAFYVVTHNGKIIAQTWAWLSQNRGVVFDSLESIVREPSDLVPVFQLVREGAQRIVQSPLGIESVFLGDTHSGITYSALDFLFSGKRRPNAVRTHPVDGGGYYDGLEHILIAGKLSRRKSKVPEVAGYSRVKFTPQMYWQAEDYVLAPEWAMAGAPRGFRLENGFLEM